MTSIDIILLIYYQKKDNRHFVNRDVMGKKNSLIILIQLICLQV